MDDAAVKAAERLLADPVITYYGQDNGPRHDGMAVARAYLAQQPELARLRERCGTLAASLTEACEHMDRARGILTNNNPRPDCNWGMLDSGDLRAALADAADDVGRCPKCGHQPHEPGRCLNMASDNDCNCGD